jgi:hypothetical protein
LISVVQNLWRIEMSEREYSDNEDRTEASEVQESQETPETRQLEEATHEPEAHVEATQEYQEAEKIEASVTGLIEEVEAPAPSEGAKEEISTLPVPIPSPADEISATPLPLPDPADEISALPLPIPDPAEEISTAQVDTPGGVIDPIEQTDMPGTHEGATAGEGGQDPAGDQATPINLPGTQDEVSATPINTPEPVPPIDATLDPEIQTQPQGLTDDPVRELDVNLPEHGLKQPEGATDVGTEMEDFMPGEGSLTGADGKPLEDGKYGQDGILGGDYGFGSGGPEDLSHESAADHIENVPGTDSPFIPGKGPGSGAMATGGGLRDDALDNFLDDEFQASTAREQREDNYRIVSPILNSGGGKEKSSGTKPVQEYDDEMPPDIPDPDDDNSSYEEEAPSKKAEISDHSQDVMNPRYDPDQISLTTPDDPDGSETPDTILPKFAERVEGMMKAMRQWVAPEKKIGSEVITDPPEHDPKSTQEKEKPSDK